MTMIFMQTGIFTFNCIYEINTVNLCTLTSVIFSSKYERSKTNTPASPKHTKELS